MKPATWSVIISGRSECVDLSLGFGFGFDVLIDGGREFVGFVDRRGLGVLLGESVALLQGG